MPFPAKYGLAKYGDSQYGVTDTDEGQVSLASVSASGSAPLPSAVAGAAAALAVDTATATSAPGVALAGAAATLVVDAVTATESPLATSADAGALLPLDTGVGSTSAITTHGGAFNEVTAALPLDTAAATALLTGQPVPALLMRPGEVRGPSGAVTPTLVGAVRTVPGQYGDAWVLEEGTTNEFYDPSVRAVTSWT